MRATMRILMVTALVGLAWMAAAQIRSDSGGKPHARSAQNKGRDMNNAISLTVQPVVSGESLVVRYTLTNDGSEAILVFDKLRERNADEPNPHQVYRYVVGSTVRLLLGPAPLPRGRNVFARQLPAVTRVEAYSSHTATLQLTLPLREYSAYFANKDDTFEPGRSSEFVLLLSYVRARGIDVMPIASMPGAFRTTTPAAAADAVLVRSDTVSLALDVQVTHDASFTRLKLPEDSP